MNKKAMLDLTISTGLIMLGILNDLIFKNNQGLVLIAMIYLIVWILILFDLDKLFKKDKANKIRETEE